MKPPLDASRAGSEAEETERQLAKLTKINAALMQRVEQSMDQQANALLAVPDRHHAGRPGARAHR